jgi:hypothetical protein
VFLDKIEFDLNEIIQCMNEAGMNVRICQKNETPIILDEKGEVSHLAQFQELMRYYSKKKDSSN